MSTTGEERIAAAFAGAGKRAALMPYLMGGYPDLEGSRQIGEACAAAGADMLELGVPFSDPLADGPVIHAAATRALEGGATVSAVLEVAAALATLVPVIAMTYINVLIAAGLERFAERLAAAGVSGVIVPDLPLEEAEPGRGRRGGRRGRARAAGGADDARRAPRGDRRAARGFLYVVSVTGTTGERGAAARRRRSLLARARAGNRGAGRARLRHLDARRRGGGGRRGRRRRDRRIAARARRGQSRGDGRLVGEFAQALR